MEHKKILLFKYLGYFLIAALSGFITYRSFVGFLNSAELGMPLLLLDTFIFLPLWFMSFTTGHKFIQENFVLTVLAPLVAFYGANLIFLIFVSGNGAYQFAIFLISSFVLILSSQLASLCEQEIKEEQ